MSNDIGGYFQNLHFQVPAQQLQPRWVCFVRAFLLYKVQIFVDMITNALRPDSGGSQAVRVSHRSKLGLHVVDPKHQSLMAEVQIHLPMLGWP